jgi:hypothetical protein
MNEKLLLITSEILVGGATIAALVVVLAASWYDLRAIVRARALSAGKKRLKSQNPSILILVYARNDAAGIVACLQSIKASRYREYQIMVCDNASTDATLQLARTYKRRNKSIPLNIYSKKVQSARSEILQLAHNKAQKRDLVFIMNANDIIPPTLLGDGAAYFCSDVHLSALRLRRHADSTLNVASLLRQYINLSLNLFRKSTSLHTIPSNLYHADPIIIRSSSIQQDSPPDARIAAYASALIVTTSGDTPRQQLHIRHALIVLVACACGVGMLSYFFYTAATLRNNTLLTLSWLLVSLWCLAAIWSDEALTVSKKIELVISVPFMYFILYTWMFAGFAKSAWRLITALPFPKITLVDVRTAIMREAYSVRF